MGLIVDPLIVGNSQLFSFKSGLNSESLEGPKPNKGKVPVRNGDLTKAKHPVQEMPTVPSYPSTHETDASCLTKLQEIQTLRGFLIVARKWLGKLARDGRK